MLKMHDDYKHTIGCYDHQIITDSDYSTYASIDTTSAGLDHDITTLSMHVRQLEKLDMTESNGDLHHQYYLAPHTNTDIVDDNVAKLTERYPIKFHGVSSMSELFGVLGDSCTRIDSVAVDAETLYEQGNAGMLEIMNTLMTIIRCKKPTIDSKDTTILISVGRKTSPAMLRELAKVPEISILCMRGGDSSFDEVCSVIEHLLRGEHHIAESIKQMMRGPRRARPNRDGIHLTSRQQQVLEMIKTRGSSNKQIARLLGLSESTVKLHIGQILKKYGCVNRTQLALTATKKKP
jgi:DNA-binding CsgD family transcriptional regulator